MFFVYILYLKNKNRLYAGMTADLKRRIYQHRNDHTKSTASKKEKPKLIFYEAFVKKEDALRREKYFKSTKGKRALKLMLKITLEGCSAPYQSR